MQMRSCCLRTYNRRVELLSPARNTDRIILPADLPDHQNRGGRRSDIHPAPSATCQHLLRTRYQQNEPVASLPSSYPCVHRDSWSHCGGFALSAALLIGSSVVLMCLSVSPWGSAKESKSIVSFTWLPALLGRDSSGCALANASLAACSASVFEGELDT